VATRKDHKAALAALRAGEVLAARLNDQPVSPLTWLSVLMAFDRGFHFAALRSTPRYSQHAATAAEECHVANVASGCITLVSEEMLVQ
jgi:hypothetical protein